MPDCLPILASRLPIRLTLLASLLALNLIPAPAAQAQAWAQTSIAEQDARTEYLISTGNGTLTITANTTRRNGSQTRTVSRARLAELDADATVFDSRRGGLVRFPSVSVHCAFQRPCVTRTGYSPQNSLAVLFSDDQVGQQFLGDLRQAIRRVAPQRPPVIADRRPWGRQDVINPTLLGVRQVEQHLALDADSLAVYQRVARPDRPEEGVRSTLTRVPLRNIDWRRTSVQMHEHGMLATKFWMEPRAGGATVYMRDFATFRSFRADMLAAAGVDARGILCVDADSVVRGVPSLGPVVFNESAVRAPLFKRRELYSDSAAGPWNAMTRGTRGTPQYSRDSATYQRLARVRDSLRAELTEIQRISTDAHQAPVRAQIEGALRSVAQGAGVPYVGTWFADQSFCPGLSNATDVAIQALSRARSGQRATGAPEGAGKR